MQADSANGAQKDEERGVVAGEGLFVCGDKMLPLWSNKPEYTESRPVQSGAT